MKNYSTLLVLMLFALIASPALAQKGEKSYKKVRIGLGLEGALPTGGLGTAYNIGAGATLRAAVSIDEKSAVTGTTGVIAFIPKDLGSGVNLKTQINIPIKAGYKYMLTEKVYGLGETGITIAKSYAASSSGQLVSATGSSFTYAAGIGAHFGVDASIRYEGYSGGGFLGLRLGFNF